jgi:hypothetical protein
MRKESLNIRVAIQVRKVSNHLSEIQEISFMKPITPLPNSILESKYRSVY